MQIWGQFKIKIKNISAEIAPSIPTKMCNKSTNNVLIRQWALNKYLFDTFVLMWLTKFVPNSTTSAVLASILKILLLNKHQI